jgi:hypothetical protein
MTDITQGAPDAPDDASLFNEATNADTLEKFENPVLPKAEPVAEKPVDRSDKPAEREAPEAAVPAGRLREEAERARRMERERDELRGQLEAYQRIQQQRPPEAQHQPPPPDIFENPAAYVQQVVEPWFQRQAAEQRRDRELMSETWANREHGRENVAAAREALGQSLQQKDPLAVVTYQQAMQHPDPYAVIMQWHRHQQVLATVGSDIEAYNKKVLENARGNARHVNVPAGQSASRPSVSPSLSDIGAGGRDEQVQEPSDAELFRAVTTAKRR